MGGKTQSFHKTCFVKRTPSACYFSVLFDSVFLFVWSYGFELGFILFVLDVPFLIVISYDLP